VRGLELGPAAGVLFAGLIFGHYGYELPPASQAFGFVMFIFSVGFQAGPSFFTVLRRDGLKYLVLSIVVALVLFFGFDAKSVNVPWAGQYELGYVYIIIAIVTVFATTSAVSITDGLDGLLAGTAALAFAAYAVIAFVQGQAFLATFSFTVVGALLGFLWYNAWPATVFMGDTGALPLGASLATVALMTGHWILLPVVGIVFVLEATSDVLQIAYFQTTGGQRLFRMTPFHHHLELIGWSEPQVVMRLYLLGIAGAMVGIALALSV